MNNICPNCGAGYNLTAAHVGRQFPCKKCGDNLLVTPTGLRSSRGAAPEAGGFQFEPADQIAANFRAVRSGGHLMDYLTFRKMILPVVIQVLFWCGVAACIIGGVFTIVTSVLAGRDAGAGAAVLGVASGLGLMILGPFGVRMYCEFIIIFFRINDTLSEIRDALNRK